MQFDMETLVIAAMLIFVPALIAIVSVKRSVSKFIHNVEQEEAEAKALRRKE